MLYNKNEMFEYDIHSQGQKAAKIPMNSLQWNLQATNCFQKAVFDLQGYIMDEALPCWSLTKLKRPLQQTNELSQSNSKKLISLGVNE